ncbi:hypothetical protein JZ751_004067 [Albula glossodonta]|uniref:SMB domain-containing protein n=1 Tax=Albula glossodonta TaxID=121402 RepID=A0A8T2PGX9_9TELE|nr:hypothetical protein JZ751_004067 [Albula glossodonta]
MSLCASAPHQDWISEHRMDYPAAVFGLLLLLLSVDGQSTTGELNGTSVNTTAPPGNNATNTTTFPLNSYSGSCSEEPALCCSGNDYNCFRGCFCDQACIQNNDCCPDYINTCRGGGREGLTRNMGSPNRETSMEVTLTGLSPASSGR